MTTTGRPVEDLANRFRYHAPRSAHRAAEHTLVREGCQHLAEQLDDLLPDGREKSVAITKIEEAMFWANAALARSADPHEGEDASS